MGGLSTSTPCFRRSLWGNNSVEKIHKAIIRHYRLEQEGFVSPIMGNAQGRVVGGMYLRGCAESTHSRKSHQIPRS